MDADFDTFGDRPTFRWARAVVAMVGVAFLLGCPPLTNHGTAQPPIAPSCSVERQESLIPNSHVWILTAKVSGFPKRAKLSYTWSTPRHLGTFSGGGKQVQFDATGVPSIDIILLVEGGGVSASCYQPI